MSKPVLLSLVVGEGTQQEGWECAKHQTGFDLIGAFTSLPWNLVDVAYRDAWRRRASIDDGVWAAGHASTRVECPYRKVDLKERSIALQIRATNAGVQVVVAVGIAIGPVPPLPGARLAAPLIVDLAYATDTSQEAILQVHKAMAAKLGRATADRSPRRNVGPVDDISTKKPDGSTRSIDSRIRCRNRYKELVAEVFVAASDIANLVDHTPSTICHTQVDPDFAFLTEARGDSVPRSDIFVANRNFETLAHNSGAFDRQRKGVRE